MKKQNLARGIAAALISLGLLSSMAYADENTLAMASTTASDMSSPMADKMGMKKDAQLVTRGEFVRAGHDVKGMASIYRLKDGRYMLRLTNFSSEQAPDLRVLLVKGTNGVNAAAIKSNGYMDLGKLKSTSGDQTYYIPSNVDLSKYRAISIWCRKFSVNFGGATLRK